MTLKMSKRQRSGREPTLKVMVGLREKLSRTIDTSQLNKPGYITPIAATQAFLLFNQNVFGQSVVLSVSDTS